MNLFIKKVKNKTINTFPTLYMFISFWNKKKVIENNKQENIKLAKSKMNGLSVKVFLPV